MVVVRRLRFPGRGRGRGRGRERERERGRDDCICEAVEQRHSCRGKGGSFPNTSQLVVGETYPDLMKSVCGQVRRW